MPDAIPAAALPDQLAVRRAATEVACATLAAGSADTAAHSDDVDVIAEGICRHLGIEGDERENVIAAARLHDIGKLAMPPAILEKRASLDDDEWTVVRRHTVLGEGIVAAVPELASVAGLVRHSHERWDGRGYPDGLAGEEIPLGSRIVFCADAFHAIRSDRSYRPGRSAGAALREVQAHAGTQFDPRVVGALAALAAEMRVVARRRHRTRRSGRLVALLMILACGVGGSALARSGLLGDSQPAAVPSPPAAGPRTPAGSGGLTPIGLAPASLWPVSCDGVNCLAPLLGVPLTALGFGSQLGIGYPASPPPGNEPPGSHDPSTTGGGEQTGPEPADPPADPAPAGGKDEAAGKGSTESGKDTAAPDAVKGSAAEPGPVTVSSGAGSTSGDGGKTSTSSKGGSLPAGTSAPGGETTAPPALPTGPAGGKVPAPVKAEG